MSTTRKLLVAVLIVAGASILARNGEPRWSVTASGQTIDAKPTQPQRQDAPPARSTEPERQDRERSILAPTYRRRPAAAPAPPSNSMSVKYMLRGYCRAVSSVLDEKARGFAPSDNYPKAIDFKTPDGEPRCYLLAEPEFVMDFGKSKGMRLLLVNAAQDAITFQGCDSRLSLVQEALDKDRQWKPIEYLPSSWCGNSYHRLTLGPGDYWAFAAPRYRGSFATKLRFRLSERKGPQLVSNEFDGSINPEQFSVKQPYEPQGLMDPYFPVPDSSPTAPDQSRVRIVR
jgi:hypothetical protein